ncbi:myrosinase 1-like [Melitaea cinxia]|uniref:myrosinase 1-like n=1 Tax=Melitaea cinxia TaxID=113334 RepID=UPI001E271F24|nr:myrosinase 1-like [Melitaea cinxia]
MVVDIAQSLLHSNSINTYEKVNEIVYLGSLINNVSGCTEEIIRHAGMSKSAMINLIKTTPNPLGYHEDERVNFTRAQHHQAVQTICMERALAFFGHIMRSSRHSLKELIILGQVEEKRAKATTRATWSDVIKNTVVSVDAVLGGREFPPGFTFGAATASYQVEGAWNVSDKSPSIWDTFVHTYPEKIVENATGDVTCDSYNNYKKDIELANEMGLHFYRISISWPRLLPTGFPDKISEDGKRFYNNVINALLEKGIQPVVTLYHWDLPQSLQDLGGWTNPLIADWFANYARVVFSLFGDSVKTWITLNEPVTFCEVSYNNGLHAPGHISPGFGNYLCNKNAILAHAKAWRIYDKEFRTKYNGKVSICNHLIWLEPHTESDVEAVAKARQLMVGMYSHPIFSSEGGWPPVIERIVAEKSKKEGLPYSRLPPFTQEEINLVKGTYDFMGFNYYSSRTVKEAKEGEQIGHWPYYGAPDIDVHLSSRPEWKKTDAWWFYLNPKGIRQQLAWIKREYGDIEILITENGFASANHGIDDQDRVQYFKDHLEQILLAIKEDGVKITGYTAWSLLDNFEWGDGYSVKFGLYQVDFEDPERKRTPRASARYYASVIKSHSLDVDDKITDEL